MTAMVTLANPLPANVTTSVTPQAFSLDDGVQTITNSDMIPPSFSFTFTTGLTGTIIAWVVQIASNNGDGGTITTIGGHSLNDKDIGTIVDPIAGFGFNVTTPGTWSTPAVPDAGSSLALLSLSLTALGVAARRFKRAAA